MLSSGVCLTVCLFWSRRLDRKKRKVCNCSWVLLEQRRPVHRHLDIVTYLRLARKATQSRRERRLYVLCRCLCKLGNRIRKGDVGDGVIRLLTLCIEGDLPCVLTMR